MFELAPLGTNYAVDTVCLSSHMVLYLKLLKLLDSAISDRCCRLGFQMNPNQIDVSHQAFELNPNQVDVTSHSEIKAQHITSAACIVLKIPKLAPNHIEQLQGGTECCNDTSYSASCSSSCKLATLSMKSN
jgi:hypothetical protein